MSVCLFVKKEVLLVTGNPESSVYTRSLSKIIYHYKVGNLLFNRLKYFGKIVVVFTVRFGAFVVYDNALFHIVTIKYLV